MIYPGNLVGNVFEQLEAEQLCRLVQSTTLGEGAVVMGGYDGSVIVQLMTLPAYFVRRQNGDHWEFHGFIEGGDQELAAAKHSVSQLLDSLGFKYQLGQ